MKRLMRTSLAALLVAMLATTVWAERIKTDGKNKDSPVEVVKIDFSDSGYGQAGLVNGRVAEIRISSTVRNTSREDTLKNVVVHLQLKNLAGEVVQEWKNQVGVMKPGQSVDVSPDALYYNYTFNNVSPAVMVEHDKVEEKKEDEKKK